MGGFILNTMIVPVITSFGLPNGLSLAVMLVYEAPCIVPLCPVFLAKSGFERSFEVLAQSAIVGVSGAISGGVLATSSELLSSTAVLLAVLTAAILILALLLRRGADRQNILRQERDAALRKIETLETLSEQDSLTGLLNRRTVEERFAKLRSEGFDTFALIDLDKFKAVNDRHGHQVGDEVLIACAQALKGNEERDYLATRPGGGEFVVLLRGVDAYYRAEKLRQSIPFRVARSVKCLDQHVTASMGLIELPRESLKVLSFSELYSRADQLLYNAKASGRDRTCFERLTVHKGAPPDRNSVQSAA